MGTTPKRKRSDTAPVIPHVTPKCHSMHILSARFTGAHTSNSGASRAGTVVTVDDDIDDDDVIPLRLRLVPRSKKTFVMLVTRMRILMRTTTMIAMRMHSYTLVLIRKHRVARIALLNLLAAVHAVLALNRLLILLRTQTLPLPSLTLHRAPKRYPLFTSLVLACTCLVKQLPSFLLICLSSNTCNIIR